MVEHNFIVNNDEQEIKGKSVRYDNSFNKTSLSVLSKVQSNILMSVLYKMGDNVQEDKSGNLCYTASYTFKDIRDMTNAKSLKAQRIKKTFDELLDTKVEFFNEEGHYVKANLFSHYSLSDKSTAEITLSNELTQKLITNKTEYTILDLNEYIELSNNYSKELYRLLRQFRHSGFIVIKKEDLLKALKPPKSYNEYDTIRKVIIPSLKKNEKYFENLKIYLGKDPNKLPESIKITFRPHKSNYKNISLLSE